jgi:hypothetical protein
LPKESFLDKCARFRTLGFSFLGLQTHNGHVSYLFQGNGEIVREEQKIEDNGVHSIAQIFPLADFAERQMYRDCRVKAIGNINLVPRETPK